MMVVGPSGCGKTVFTTELLFNNLELFVESPKSIHYCYGSWQKGYEPLKKGGVKFHEGVPDSESLPKWFPQRGVLVMDDLMDEGSNDKSVLDLFTKHSHHQNITVIYLCQDLFQNGKFARPSHAMRIMWWLSRTHAINSECEMYYYNCFLQNGKKYWRRSEK